MSEDWLGYARDLQRVAAQECRQQETDKATIARLTAERDEARAAGFLAGLAQARDICKRVRHREDLSDVERCGVLEGALAIQDEIARLDQPTAESGK